MNNQYEDKEFLEFVVKSIVDNPNDVHVDRSVDEMGVLMTLDVHPDDMGKVIGRNGNTAKAVRTLLRVVGMKNQARVNLKINEPDRDAESSQDKTSDPVSSAVDDAMEELKS